MREKQRKTDLANKLNKLHKKIHEVRSITSISTRVKDKNADKRKPKKI